MGFTLELSANLYVLCDSAVNRGWSTSIPIFDERVRVLPFC
jgi:hypothetical protein